MFALEDMAGAVAGAVVVLFTLMIGSGIGEEVASFLFGRIKGRMTQIIYLLLFMPLFVLGGYANIYLQIPQTLPSTALFFGLWGVFTVFTSRFILHLGSKALGIRYIRRKKTHVNGKELIKHLKEKKLQDNEIRQILYKSCDSERKAQKIFEGGSEWVNIDPEALCYELSKRGFNVHEVMKILKEILRMNPEESANVWRNASV
ncbi:MAG: hypothetical protein U9Q22_04950 [Candidatus Altiarchaeota archaeon]|nr:hypothetical protein [Candidatus Altiarchaeota archaeon]